MKWNCFQKDLYYILSHFGHVAYVANEIIQQCGWYKFCVGPFIMHLLVCYGRPVTLKENWRRQLEGNLALHPGMVMTAEVHFLQFKNGFYLLISYKKMNMACS